MASSQSRSKSRSAARRANANKSITPIQTIGDLVLVRLKELNTVLSAIRDAPEPVAFALNSLGVFRGLSEKQQHKLLALVLKLYAQGHGVKWLAAEWRERRRWKDDGERRLRVLKKKMAKALRAVTDVNDYLTAIDVTDSDLLGEAVRVLDCTELQEADAQIALLKEPEPSEDAMLTLYDFFVEECGLKNNESEVRVCIIGNYLWDWDVAVTEQYQRFKNLQNGPRPQKAESFKACDAVHQAVRRRKVRQGRSKK